MGVSGRRKGGKPETGEAGRLGGRLTPLPSPWDLSGPPSALRPPGPAELSLKCPCWGGSQWGPAQAGASWPLWRHGGGGLHAFRGPQMSPAWEGPHLQPSPPAPLYREEALSHPIETFMNTSGDLKSPQHRSPQLGCGPLSGLGGHLADPSPPPPPQWPQRSDVRGHRS